MTSMAVDFFSYWFLFSQKLLILLTHSRRDIVCVIVYLLLNIFFLPVGGWCLVLKEGSYTEQSLLFNLISAVT